MPDSDPSRLAAAYQKVLPALRAIPPADVKKPRVEMATAGALVLAAMPKVEKYKEALLALPLTDKTLVEELPLRAMAMMQAFADFSSTATPTFPLQALALQGAAVREKLLAAADMLVAYGPLQRALVDQIREGTGYADLGRDLLVLGRIFGREGPSMGPAEAQTKALVHEALQLGDQILVMMGEKAQPVSEEPEAVQLRDRAYTHFLAAYNNVRHGLDYLRGREGDADKILPSIFSYRRGHGDDPAPPEPTRPTDGAAPVPLNGGAPPARDPDSPFTS